jgi:hypothetical protein
VSELALSLPAEVCRCIDGPCDTFESRWRRGERPAIEDLLGSVPATARPLLLEELIRTELEWRWRLGERPTAEEFSTRFPDCAGSIESWLGEARAAAAALLRREGDTKEIGPVLNQTQDLAPSTNAAFLNPAPLPKFWASTSCWSGWVPAAWAKSIRHATDGWTR